MVHGRRHDRAIIVFSTCASDEDQVLVNNQPVGTRLCATGSDILIYSHSRHLSLTSHGQKHIQLHKTVYVVLCSTVSYPAPVPHPGILCHSLLGRVNFFQSIVTFFKYLIVAYSIGTCQNDMSDLEDKEIEHELKSSQEIPDDVASGRAIGSDSERGRDHKTVSTVAVYHVPRTQQCPV